MPDILSQEISKRVRAFCEEVLDDANLPDATIAELEDHFQDRMLGYLNGTDPLSEEDAFLLTQEHFGDPQAVRDLFADARPGTSRVAGYRWFLVGAALMPMAFVVSVGGFLLPGLDRIVGSLYFLEMPFYGASLVILGAAMIVVRHAHVMTMDRIFGWYLLAFLSGDSLLCTTWPFAQLPVMPLNVGLMLVQLALMLTVAVSFFRHAAWGKWLLLALLLLPFLSGMARDRLNNETDAAISNYTANHAKHPAQANGGSSQALTSTVVHVETKTVEIPPKGFSQALYVLALLHAFLPRRSIRLGAPHTLHLTDTA